MKAKVDRDTCVGCGLCESVCPTICEHYSLLLSIKE